MTDDGGENDVEVFASASKDKVYRWIGLHSLEQLKSCLCMNHTSYVMTDDGGENDVEVFVSN